jgi:hypothetical protein
MERSMPRQINILNIVQEATAEPRYAIEAAMIEAVGAMIRACSFEELKATAASTKADGALWAMVPLAQAEIDRRCRNLRAMKKAARVAA